MLEEAFCKRALEQPSCMAYPHIHSSGARERQGDHSSRSQARTAASWSVSRLPTLDERTICGGAAGFGNWLSIGTTAARW
jgi:hypothetical protein